MNGLKKRSNPLKNDSGEMMFELMAGMLIITVVFLYAIDFFGLFLESQNVNYSAKSIAKVIECEGEVSQRAYDQMQKLNQNFNMDMSFQVTDVNYLDNNKKNIQFLEPFKVTVSYTAKQEILSPIFSDPVVIKIHMKADAPGRSEVYWK